MGSKVRYGSARFYFDPAWFYLVLGICIYKISFNKNYVFVFYFCLLLCIFGFAIFINKSRMLVVNLITCLLICLVLQKRSSIRKTVSLCLSVIFSSIFLLYSSIGKDIISVIIGNESESGDTSTVREIGREYYFSMLTRDPLHFIFGYGYPSPSNSIGKSIVQPNLNDWVIYPEDNGIIGYSIYYGFISIFIWLGLLWLCLHKSWFINRHHNDVSFCFKVFAEVIPCLTLVPSFFYSTFSFSFYFVLLAYKYSEDIRRIKYNEK